MTTGQTIRYFRRNNQMTQETLGKKLGVTKQVISNIERGTTQPSIKVLKEISKLLTVDLAALMQGDPKKNAAVQQKREEQHDLKVFLDHNKDRLTYNGESLTLEELKQLNLALEMIFWHKNHQN